MDNKENEKLYPAAGDISRELDAAGKDPAGEASYIIVFKKPVTFDGMRYDSVDLSGLEDLSAADMISANKTMERSGTVNVLPELSLEYACLMASKACGMPVEFFKSLPPREALKVKNRVTSFLYSED